MSVTTKWRSTCARMTRAANGCITWTAPKFVRRFLLHVLPAGIKRIRHYGVLASSCKAVKLAQARAALQMPVPNALALACALAFMARVAGIDIALCPACKVGRLRVAFVMPGSGYLPAPGHVLTPNERGPP
jgi:hypothetical protein